MAIGVLYWVLSLSCWVFALRFGGRTSLWAFLLFLAAMIATSLASLPRNWGQTNLPLFLVDCAYFAGLYVLALNSRTHWPIWSAGLQLLAALSHIGPLLDQGSDPKIYRGLESVWMIPMLLTMAIGIHLDRRIGRRSRIN